MAIFINYYFLFVHPLIYIPLPNSIAQLTRTHHSCSSSDLHPSSQLDCTAYAHAPQYGLYQIHQDHQICYWTVMLPSLGSCHDVAVSRIECQAPATPHCALFPGVYMAPQRGQVTRKCPCMTFEKTRLGFDGLK